MQSDCKYLGVPPLVQLLQRRRHKAADALAAGLQQWVKHAINHTLSPASWRCRPCPECTELRPETPSR